MNIHEHQAKEILKKFNIKILKGFTIFSLEEIEKKYKTLKTKKVALKAQIHAGGRGKAGGIKIVNDIEELNKEAKILFGTIDFFSLFHFMFLIISCMCYRFSRKLQ